MKSAENKTEFRFLPRGVVEDAKGRVAGMWIKNRRRRDVFLFEKPIEKRPEPFTVIYRDINVDGCVYRNFPVKKYVEVNALNHWGRSRAEE